MHAQLEQFFGKMEILSIQLIQKILQKKQQNEMASIVRQVCEQVIQFTAYNNGSFKVINLHQPPVYLINGVSAFARLIKNTLDIYTGSGKEELINYFVEWCDVTQGELESAFTSLANYSYNHQDIRSSLNIVSRFTGILLPLFINLARLDYIGKRKEVGIFVKEQIIAANPEVQPIPRRSFLAD
jgi:hypothetical protein